MENYLVELAKSRASLLNEMMKISWSYTGKSDKVATIQAEVAKIDAMIDKVIEPAGVDGKFAQSNVSHKQQGAS